MSDSTVQVPQQVQALLHDGALPAHRKYALLTAGTPSLAAWMKYDLIIGLFGGCPGALGYLLRQKAYRALLGGMGRGCMIGRHVTLRGVPRVRLGRDVALDDYSVVDARGDAARITIGNGVLLGRNSIVRSRNGSVMIGAGTDIGCHCILATDSELHIADEVLIAAYVYIPAGGNHRFDDLSRPILRQGFEPGRGVRIGRGAWIGAKSVILDGVTIGAGAVIGAGSLVKKDIPENAVAFGSPAAVRWVRGENRPQQKDSPRDEEVG